MALPTYDAATPLSSTEIAIDHERYENIERKHERIAEFLGVNKYDGLLLQRPANFAWFTAGADCTRGSGGEPVAALFITRDARLIVANNADSALFFDVELLGLGFQLKERPWFEPKAVLLTDLCRSRKVASDTGNGATIDATAFLNSLRVPLTLYETEHLRQVGRRVAHALEVTARALVPGRTEAEIAGEVAHRLLKHQVSPVRIQVLGDGRGRRYRHWGAGSQPVQKWCTVAAVGRRFGVCAAAVRTVALEPLDPTIISAFQAATVIHATAMYFSQVDWPLNETWERIKRMYEKVGFPEEWRLADFGGVIGYEPCEIPVVPGLSHKLAARTALDWHPSIGPMLVGDTILTTPDGFEIVTPSELWPSIEVTVKNSPVACPGIFIKANESVL